AHRLDGNHENLLVWRFRELSERLDVFVGDKIVQRGDVAFGDRLAHHLRRAGFGFRRAFACFGIAERGLAAAFRLQDLALFGAFAASNTWKNATPSTVTVALSLVITSCSGIEITCSIMFILRPTWSKYGMIRFSPGASVRVNLPNRSMVQP